MLQEQKIMKVYGERCLFLKKGRCGTNSNQINQLLLSNFTPIFVGTYLHFQLFSY